MNSAAKKGVFAKFSNFSHVLGIKILKLCEKYKSLNGGIMPIEDVVQINNRAKHNDKINRDDVVNCIQHLAVLGTGCAVVDNKYVSTSPFPLNKDAVTLLAICNATGVVNQRVMQEKAEWSADRFAFVIVPSLEADGSGRPRVGR